MTIGLTEGVSIWRAREATGDVMVERLWRPQDILTVAVLNLVGAAMLGVAWSKAADATSLVGQVGPVRVAILGLVLAGLADTVFLLAAKHAVATRCGRTFAAHPAGRIRVHRVRPAHHPSPPPSANDEPTPAGVARRRLRWWWLHWDRALALGLAGLGAASLASGWFAASWHLAPEAQVPYVVGGGLGGLYLLGVGATAWLAAALRDQWSALDRIAGRLGYLGAASIADVLADRAGSKASAQAPSTCFRPRPCWVLPSSWKTWPRCGARRRPSCSRWSTRRWEPGY